MSRPLIAITAFFSVGIITHQTLSLPVYATLALLALSLLTIVIWLVKKRDASLLVISLFFLLGVTDSQLHNQTRQSDLARWVDKGAVTVVGEVTDQSRLKDSCLSFPLRVSRVEGQLVGGDLWVYWRDNNNTVNYGDRVRIEGRLAELATYHNPIISQGDNRFALYVQSLTKVGRGGHCLKQGALWFNQRFNQVLVQILPAAEGSLLGSILLGSAVSPLPDELKTTYQKAGLIHLLVVSGTQVSIMIGVCLSLCRAVNLPLWCSVGLTSFFNLMLVIITGGGAAILRAAIMGEITLIGLLFERDKEVYTALALSALVLLIYQPNLLFNIGFQLSFAATWGLVYLVPVLAKSLGRTLAISLAPLLATSPIIYYHFSQLSPGAIIANLLVLPWVEFLVILGLTAMLLGFICLPLAQLLGATIWLMLTVLNTIAKIISNLPGAFFYLPAPSGLLVAGYYLGLIAVVEQVRAAGRLVITKKRLTFALICLLTIVVWQRAISTPTCSAGRLKVTFLDVGQGDCTLIESPGGRKILIDGGGREGEDIIGQRVVVPFLRRQGINSLDLVILTHPHADHLGGLVSVLKEIKAEQVVEGVPEVDSVAYRRFIELIERNRIKHHLARVGEVIELDQGVRAEVLNPDNELLDDANANSVVLRLRYGQAAFLLAGDLDLAGEKRLQNQSLHAAVLKVGHHGSATSTSDDFLDQVRPSWAVISVGKYNKFHHPHPSTLKRLQAKGVKVLRTDLNGAVTVQTDGRSLVVNSVY
jgi:competence protein ComEC